jgi:hypothetical protein
MTNNKIKPGRVEVKLDGKRFQRLSSARPVARTPLTKAILGIKTVYRFDIGFFSVVLGFVVSICGSSLGASAYNDNATADQKRRHHHHDRVDHSGEFSSFQPSDRLLVRSRD